MKPVPVLWTYYVKRRKLVLAKWLNAKGIKTKKDLQNWCAKNFVQEPEKKDDVWKLFIKPKKKGFTPPEAPAEPTPITFEEKPEKKKTVRKRKKKDE